MEWTLNWWSRLRAYGVEVWLEVKPKDGKVTWPSWPEVKGSTKVVMTTVGITLLFLLVVDLLLAEAVSLVFGR